MTLPRVLRLSLIAAALVSPLAVGVAAGASGWTDPATAPAEVLPLTDRSLMLDIVRAGDRYVAVGARGSVLVSDDGAAWRQVEVPTRATLTALAAVDAQVWAVGHDGMILHSADAGQTWQVQRKDPWIANGTAESARDPKQGAPLLDVLFLDEQHGFAIGAYSLLLRTSDGGNTWEEVKLSAGGAAPAAAPAKGQGDDWTFGQEELKVGEETDPHLNAIAKTGDGTLVIVGERGAGFRSTDHGVNWTKIKLPYEGSMFGVIGYDDRHVLAFGPRGHALESNDGGSSWHAIDTGVDLSLMGGVGLPQGGAILVGANGVVLRRATATAPFQRSTYENSEKETPVLASVLAIGDDTFVIAGEKGVDAFQLH
jgi:photosystem II stability/assembly factor-like uncharacterized protein